MTEREQFEGAMLAEVIMPRPHLAAHIETIFERHEFGDCGYKQMWLDSAWLGWQAARATPALPQGVEEWIEKNSEYADKVYDRHAKFQSMKKYVAVDDLRAYLSGMAIVPVKPTPEMINAALPSAMRESDEDKYRAIGMIICIWDEMLAAAKEKKS